MGQSGMLLKSSCGTATLQNQCIDVLRVIRKSKASNGFLLVHLIDFAEALIAMGGIVDSAMKTKLVPSKL